MSLRSVEPYKNRLAYDPETGIMTWRDSESPRFNKMFSGKRAGFIHTEKKSGKCYWKIIIKGVCSMLPQHRIAFAMMTGRWPRYIDHINGNGMDNRWDNLREVGVGVNNRNTALRKENTTGIPGVQLRGNSYRVMSKKEGRNVSLGTYSNIFDAACAKKSFEFRNNFHQNHGRNTGIFGADAIHAVGAKTK